MLLRFSQASSERGLKRVAVCTARKRTSLNVLLLGRHTVSVNARHKIAYEPKTAAVRPVPEQGFEEQTAAATLTPARARRSKNTRMKTFVCMRIELGSRAQSTGQLTL